MTRRLSGLALRQSVVHALRQAEKVLGDVQGSDAAVRRAYAAVCDALTLMDGWPDRTEDEADGH